jgi:hypothetical protein
VFTVPLQQNLRLKNLVYILYSKKSEVISLPIRSRPSIGLLSYGLMYRSEVSSTLQHQVVSFSYPTGFLRSLWIYLSFHVNLLLKTLAALNYMHILTQVVGWEWIGIKLYTSSVFVSWNLTGSRTMQPITFMKFKPCLWNTCTSLSLRLPAQYCL